MGLVQTKELVKHYGRVQALQGVSLTVQAGEIFGLLGQNGAGKSTLIKILLGIVKPSSGWAELLDAPAGTTYPRRRVGYLPEDHRFPEYHTGASLLDFYGQLYGLSRADRRKRADEYLELVGIAGRKHSRIRTYSKGMKQRLGIAQAIFHDPELIFLDEPTDGVDPLGRREIRSMMQELKARGKTIFLNSHLLGEVEQVCDRVAIMNKGKLVREGDIATLTKTANVFVIGLAPGEAFPADEVRRHGYPVRAAEALWEVEIPEKGSIDPVLDLLRDRGLHLRHLLSKRTSLEELFLQTVEAAEPGVDVPKVKRVVPVRVISAEDRL